MKFYTLNVIRALAALSVFATHFDQQFPVGAHGALFCLVHYFDAAFMALFGANHGEHPGVVIFIVLSGFCIHLPNARHPAAVNRPRFWPQYFTRRLVRIFPVYLAGCVMGFLYVVVTSGQSLALLPHALLYDIGIILPMGFFADRMPLGNTILTTVIVEMCLYLFYPVLLLLKRISFWLPAVFAFALYGVNLLFLRHGWDPAWVSRNFYSFLPLWVMGLYAVELCFNPRRPPPVLLRLLRPRAAPLALAALYVLYLLSGFWLSKGAHLIKTPLFGFLIAWSLFLLIQAEIKQPARFRRLSAFNLLADSSYSLYAFHFPLILTLFALSFGDYSVFFGTLAIVYLLYLLVERPSHELSKRLAKRLTA